MLWRDHPFWTRDDKLMPPARAKRLAGRLESALLVWIDDSRTLIPIYQPMVLTDHLRPFLAAHTRH